jgi:hypothetical protein
MGKGVMRMMRRGKSGVVNVWEGRQRWLGGYRGGEVMAGVGTVDGGEKMSKSSCDASLDSVVHFFVDPKESLSMKHPLQLPSVVPSELALSPSVVQADVSSKPTIPTH